MTPILLSVRVSRRAIAATRLVDEAVVFADERHLNSRSHRAVVSAVNYVTRLLDTIKPMLLVLDAPPLVVGSSTDQIVSALGQLAASRGVEVLRVSKTEVLAAYALVGLRHRNDLRRIVEGFWPELPRVGERVKPFVADAAATALYADTRLALERLPA